MIYQKINKNFGVKIFKNPNTLKYILFNFFFKKNIVDGNEKFLSSYHNLGYFKPHIDSKELANYLSKKIQEPDAKIIEESSNKYYSRFAINKEMRTKIKDHLNIKFKDIFEAFKRYYRSGIAVHNIQIKRNYGIEKLAIIQKKRELKTLNIIICIFIVIIIL